MNGTKWLVLASLLWLVPIALGEDTCSLHVIVVSPKGTEVEATVKVTEKNGRVIERENELGGAKFCDLGISSVTVSVGGEGACNGVTVHNVRLRWATTTLVRVIYDWEPCSSDFPPPPVPLCRTLLRIRNSKEEWLSGAEVKVNTPFQHRYSADEC
ncbi:MAG: hypothetical protein AB1898_32510, partial [Acidobacteriota bacterium]